MALCYSSYGCGVDVRPPDPHAPQYAGSDFVLAAGQRVLVCLLSRFLGNTTIILGKSAVAATFGLMTSIGQLGGISGNYTIGFLNERTRSFGFIALVYIAAASIILGLRIRHPLNPSDA